MRVKEIKRGLRDDDLSSLWYRNRIYDGSFEVTLAFDEYSDNVKPKDFTLGESLNKLLFNITEDIKQVIYNAPATIVIWSDETKTVVKVQNDEYFDKEKGLAMCIIKKLYGDKGSFNNVFKKWCE